MDENPTKKDEKTELRDEKGRFVPGVLQPGAGRPAGSFSIRRMIADKMRENPEEAREFIEMIYRRAKEGNDSKEFKYVETIIESVDGKLTQPIDQSVTVTDLSEFTAEELQAFRDMIRERRDGNGG